MIFWIFSKIIYCAPKIENEAEYAQTFFKNTQNISHFFSLFLNTGKQGRRDKKEASSQNESTYIYYTFLYRLKKKKDFCIILFQKLVHNENKSFEFSSIDHLIRVKKK